VSGCSDDDASPEASGSATSAVADAAVEFMQLRSSDWERGEAIRPVARPPEIAVVERSLDWWAEYHREVPIAGGVEVQDLRVSGHHVGLDTQINELKNFDVESGEVAGRRAALATSSEGTPVAVLIEVRPDYTVMALSFALSSDELTALAADLETVSEDEWLASGGRVVDCAPPTADCPAPG
jgi:hypothetical protein